MGNSAEPEKQAKIIGNMVIELEDGIGLVAGSTVRGVIHVR